ncbi:hypothetical protein MHK_009135 [Candidatus Magnetomorum sp. HK-1]|nr:hypothetical protein MHK_009135 [Candidatus Magnetomorum sp. HK-1]
MKHKNFNDISQKDSEDLLLMLAIHNKQSISGKCLDNETFWALANNRLSEKKTQAIKHLNSCPDCYGKWSELIKYLNENSDVYQKPTFRFADSYFKAGVAVAAIILICFYFFFNSSTLESLIEQSYDIAIENKILKQAVDTSFIKPSNIFAFSASQGQKPEYLAFLSGIQNGQSFLTQSENKTEQKKHFQPDNHLYYFYLGKWLILTIHMCHAKGFTENDPLWDKQKAIGHLLCEKFPTSYHEYPLMKRRWNQIIETMNNKKLPIQKKCRELKFKLENMAIFLKN